MLLLLYVFVCAFVCVRVVESVYLRREFVFPHMTHSAANMTLEEIQAKMEREAPGFVANPREPPKIRREMKMYDSAVSAIRGLCERSVSCSTATLAYF